MDEFEGAVDSADVISWVRSVVGVQISSYLLACSEGELQEFAESRAELSPGRIAVVANLAELRVRIAADAPGVDEAQVAPLFLFAFSEGRTVARRLHDAAAATEAPEAVVADGPAQVADPVEETADEVVREIALDLYGAFLLPPEIPDVPGLGFNGAVVRGFFGHPARERLDDLLMQDAAVAKVFAGPGVSGFGPAGYVRTNAGSGGELHLNGLVRAALDRAWDHGLQPPVPTGFSAAAADELRSMLAILRKENKTATARVHLTGVLLPEECELELAEVRIRATTDSEYRQAPGGIRGKLSGTVGDGEPVVIDYSGDIALEIPYPYVFNTKPPKNDTDFSWLEQNNPGETIQQVLTRVRFALLLAVKREQARVQVVPAWQILRDPLAEAQSMTWWDNRSTGLTPIRLTREEADAWAHWYGRLKTPGIEKIDLGIRRVLRALSERRDPADVLVDAVIAWENLFGTKDGEPTFRITMCLATLLESDVAERGALRTELAKIYDLRSKIVHGSADLKVADVPVCHRALDVAVDAIKALVDQRPDILRLTDGGLRSVRLLLE
ncbi:hypothetical protein CFP65_4562 [Kitasatospora sp. MMS16-BH015]|uniref:HEPN domain-containing protein n=1 Tax=Kitasatospora sp. MMS16-BH015 TaxID=2018025 RepID=UPI000CA17C39|nr:HEPN domain-containing protein [Kitasatospora sp. MMS16-BH015]AUG79303.1 hypothetical protein CFP65_4562 [Kitasatospora sp. MMS16-BH015]